MALTSRGEILGVLEREAKRAADLYEAAQALIKLDDESTKKTQDLSRLLIKITDARTELATLTTRISSVQAQAVEAERKAKARLDATEAVIADQIAARQNNADARVKGVEQAATEAIARWNAAARQAEQAAAQAEQDLATTKAAVAAELRTLASERTALKAEIDGLRKRVAAIVG